MFASAPFILASGSPAPVPGFLGWEAVDIPLLLVLPILLVFSAFFSGSETALFGLTQMERMQLRRGGTIAGRAVGALLAEPRMLLITVLLGNMTVNVLYFVVSSVLLMRAETGVIGSALLATGTLLIIVLLGEVLPKMVANSHRSLVASFVAPILLALHGLIAPLRLVLDRAIVQPLSRLTAPHAAPPELNEEELQALLEISGRQGVIDADEQRVLRDVISLGRLRVRDVMTPRVQMHAVHVGASRQEIEAMAREARLTRLPVYGASLDEIVGILPVRAYLIDAQAARRGVRRSMRQPQFVPLLARLDQLLEHFRQTRSQSAIVVDEYGGTAGIVSIEDVVTRLVGDLAGADDHEAQPPELIRSGQWRVDGDMSVHDWAEAFGQRLVSPRVATLGGLIIERLGRAPHVGDVVMLGNLRLEVAAVDRARIEAVLITLNGAGESPTEGDNAVGKSSRSTADVNLQERFSDKSGGGR